MKETRLLTSTEIFSLSALLVSVYMERKPSIAVNFFSYNSSKPNQLEIQLEIFAPENSDRFFVCFNPKESDNSLKIILNFYAYLIKHTGAEVDGWDDMLEDLGIVEKIEFHTTPS